jgi:hypothetical protein
MQFYRQTLTLHKGFTWEYSRFFVIHRAVHRAGAVIPQPPRLSTALSTASSTVSAPPGRQKTGMMSSGLMSADTSTPSMSSSGMAGNSMPQRCTMTRILAIACFQFSA